MESVNNSGTFAEVSCPRLLVHLHQARFDGTLRVTQQGPVKLLYFQRGEIAMASSNDSKDHLAPILIREGKLKSEQLDLARKSAKPGTSLARVLVQMGFLTSGELFSGARQQLRQIVGSLLCLTDAQYSVEKDHFPREITSLNVDTREMILDLVRKISERTFILSEVGSPDTRWEPAPAYPVMLAALRLPIPWKELADRFTSPRTTHEFGQSSGLDDFEASKVVYGLQLMGLLTPETPAAREEPLPVVLSAAPEPPGVEEPVAAPEKGAEAEPELREGERIEFQAVPARAAVGAGPEVRGVAAPIRFEIRDEPNAPGGGRPAEDLRPREKEEPGGRVLTSGGEATSREFEGPAFPAVAAARRRSGLGSILSILTGLAILASAFYWFVFLREPAAEGSASPPPVVQVEKVPNSDSAPPEQERPREGSPETLATPSANAGSEPAPTQESPPSGGSGPAEDVPPSHPDASPPIAPPPREVPAPPEATAPAPSFSDAGRFVEARGRLDQGEYRDAAAAWLAAVQREKSKRFTLQIAIACQEETLRTAAARTRGSVFFFAVPFDLGGKPCFRLCWGAYGTVEEAQSDKNAVPHFFLSEGVKPVVVSFGKLLPAGDR